MNKKETLTIIKIVVASYQNFRLDDATLTLEAWHEILQDYEFNQVKQNLKDYIKTGTAFPPAVGQLIGVREKRTVANLEETRLMLKEKDMKQLETQKLLQDPDEQQKIAAVKASIRATLGMPKREEG